MPKTVTDRSTGKIKVLSGLIGFFKPYRLRLLLALMALTIAAAATLALPVAIRELVDKGFFINDNAAINQYFLLLILLVLLLAVFASLRFYWIMWLGERIVADIRSQLFQHILTLDPYFFEVTPTGEVLSRITTDTTLVQSVVGSGVSITLRSLFVLIGSLFMLSITSFKLTLIILVIVPLVLVPLFYFGRKVRRLSRINQDCIAQSSALAGESLNAIQIIQAFVMETFIKQRFDTSVEAAFNTARQRLLARALLAGFAIFIVFSAILTIIWVGSQMVRQDQMSIGQLSQFLVYAVIVATNCAALSEVWGDMQRAAGALERILEILNQHPQIYTPNPSESLQQIETLDIHFDQISFNYPSRPEQPALDNFTLTIKAGETVALVGPSGAGKSTVFQLMLRFYDPQQGAIRLENTAIHKLDLQYLRHVMGIVPQETAIFASTVTENIRYGNIDASEQDIKSAAIAAAADQFVQQLPDGYQTFLGERGIRLSGGQKQRIAIARAILKNPPILLLDEATNALDSESEKLVQNALENLMRNRTTLVIAHRLATVLKADKIVVLEHGKIVAIGTHQQLLQQGGLYAKLAALQFDQAPKPHSNKTLYVSN